MKKKLRKEALTKRTEMPAEERAEKSRRITEHILQSEVYQKARSVFSFVRNRLGVGLHIAHSLQIREILMI